jgi:outer membrane protein OmpA-like peptidoglycan-associated protein
MGQTQQLQKMGIDSRITSAMGIPDLQDVLGIQSRREMDTSDDARPLARGSMSSPERGWIGWLLGVGAAALIAGVLWSMFGKPDLRRIATPGEIADVSAAGRMNVYFDPGRAALDADDWRVIDSIASTARARERTVVLTGATGRTGDARQNLALVEQRVAAIRDGLVSKGVPDARIVVKPPMPATDSEVGAQRVQIELRPEP